MKKIVKIFFVGRKHGIVKFKARPWKMENSRSDELSAFKAVKNLKRVYSPSKANVIFIRNCPEKTTFADLQRIESRIGKYRGQKLIINDINAFYNHNSKDRTLGIWKDNNLNCANFITINNGTNDEINTVRIQKFIEQHNSILLRTNNEEGGIQVYHLDQNTNEEDIINILGKLKDRVNLLRKRGHTDARIVGVQFLKHNSRQGYQHLFRAYICVDKILGIDLATAKGYNIHASTMKMKDFDYFLDVYKKYLPYILEAENAKQLLNAAKVLGSNIGGLDFFIIDGKLFFLEHNPMWGGAIFSQDITEHVLQNRRELQEIIPDIYKIFDGKLFYKSLYTAIYDYVRQHT